MRDWQDISEGHLQGISDNWERDECNGDGKREREQKKRGGEGVLLVRQKAPVYSSITPRLPFIPSVSSALITSGRRWGVGVGTGRR